MSLNFSGLSSFQKNNQNKTLNDNQLTKCKFQISIKPAKLFENYSLLWGDTGELCWPAWNVGSTIQMTINNIILCAKKLIIYFEDLCLIVLS